MLQAELDAKTAVTPEQVNDFYVKNPAAVSARRARASASHILMRVQAERRRRGTREGAREGGRRPGGREGGQGLRRARQAALRRSGQRRAGRRPRLLPARPDGAARSSRPPSPCRPAQTSDLVEIRLRLPHHPRRREAGGAHACRSTRCGRSIEQYLDGQNREQQTQAFVDGAQGQGQGRNLHLSRERRRSPGRLARRRVPLQDALGSQARLRGRQGRGQRRARQAATASSAKAIASASAAASAATRTSSSASSSTQHVKKSEARALYDDVTPEADAGGGRDAPGRARLSRGGPAAGTPDRRRAPRAPAQSRKASVR